MSDWVDVAAVEDFPSGTCRTIVSDEVSIAIFNINGRYYAIENKCTHEDAELSSGKLEQDVIVCPLHGARFSLLTGEALTAPAYENLRTFPVRINNSWIEVDTEAEWNAA
ncbi:Rieske (2Fe-2S) protein [Methylotenera mobilis]|jgi:3-phenylpropionate/trans-cinnamate dioxygenase ferredoxin subunit|uniref:Rieske (2Fe-2S) protein n=1 Tax=Methylotenera mobilis TaxID=359408 RepID=UPI00037BC691|nr:non-heme iron oxygenase ferredoxin subunit [Methylotenera mobilis]